MLRPIVRSFRGVGFAVILGASALCLGGCAAPQGEYDKRLDQADWPRTFRQARHWEEFAHDAIRAARASHLPRKQAEKIDEAIFYYHRARSLFEEELIAGEGPPERRRNLEMQIDRIDGLIYDIHTMRPVIEAS